MADAPWGPVGRKRKSPLVISRGVQRLEWALYAVIGFGSGVMAAVLLREYLGR